MFLSQEFPLILPVAAQWGFMLRLSDLELLPCGSHRSLHTLKSNKNLQEKKKKNRTALTQQYHLALTMILKNFYCISYRIRA